MRRMWLFFLVIVFAGFSGMPVLGHNAGLSAILNVEPGRPAPGQNAVLRVDLLDAYGNEVPGAKVRGALLPAGKTVLRPADLTETVAGGHSGRIRVPGAGIAVLKVEALLPDGLYLGELPIRIGEGGTEVWELRLELVHEDELNEPAAGAAVPLQGSGTQGSGTQVPASQPRPGTTSTNASAPNEWQWPAALGAMALLGLWLVARRRKAG